LSDEGQPRFAESKTPRRQSVRGRSVSNDFRPRNWSRVLGQRARHLPGDRSVFPNLGRKAHVRRQRQKGQVPMSVLVGEGQVRFWLPPTRDRSVSNDFRPRNWTRGVGQGARYFARGQVRLCEISEGRLTPVDGRVKRDRSRVGCHWRGARSASPNPKHHGSWPPTTMDRSASIEFQRDQISKSFYLDNVFEDAVGPPARSWR